MIESLRTYPGFSQRQLIDDLDLHVENIERLGYSVIPGVISRDEAGALHKRMIDIWQKQASEFGEERLASLGKSNSHRSLFLEDERFMDMIVHPQILAVVDRLIGKTAILNLQTGSASFPGGSHFQSGFHRDFAKDFVASKPLSLNAFWCIDDFTEENGATQVVPFTHVTPELPSMTWIEANTRSVMCSAGSVILFNSFLLHRAGTNRSSLPRFGVNHMYTRPFLKQQVDFPALLGGRIDLESRLGQVLGFWTIPPKSIEEFRVDSDRRTYRGGQG